MSGIAAPRHSRTKGKFGGFSLLESLIVTTLFLLAMAMINTLFLYTTRFTKAGGERTELQERRVQVADDLRRAMAHSQQSGNTLLYVTSGAAQDDLALSFIEARDANGVRTWDAASGGPEFQGYQIFFRNAEDNTVRSLRLAIPPTRVAQSLSEVALREAIATRPNRIVCEGVTTFQAFLYHDGSVTDGWSNPVALRLVQRTSRDTAATMEINYRFPTL